VAETKLHRIRLVYTGMYKVAVLLLGCLPLAAQVGTPVPRPPAAPQQGGSTAGPAAGREGVRNAGPRRGQGPGQAAQQPSGPPGSVRGQVLSSTGEPLRKAEVALRPLRGGGGFNPPGGFAMTTDASGVFAFDGVPPGEYMIVAQRNGYVRHDLAMRGGSVRGTPPVIVGPGQAVTGVTIKLVPHGVVTGRVVDEDGEAAARISVQVQRERWVRGQRQLMTMSADTTNDLGEYRVAGLPSGRYFVVADASRQSGGMGPMMRRPDAAGEPNYTTMFYPNATDPAQATPIEVGSGQETRGVDFRLRKVATYRIRGRVVDPSGGPMRNLMVMVMPGESGSGLSSRNPAAVRNEDGTFEIRGIAPGAYTLVANRMGRDQGRATTSQQINVGNRDLDGVALTLSPPLDITGTVQTEGNASLNLGSMRVFLEPAATMPMFGGTAPATVANGNFKLSGISPGSYRVRAR
jgi:protocatechuate 3,4-dioxygenase beta subunit